MSADTLEQAFASTARILANVSPDQLDGPTPCRSWTVRDLVNHIVGGATFFAVIAETGEAPGRADQAADFTRENFCAGFDQGAKRAVSAFRADGVMEKIMTLPFGQLPGAVFVNIAATDTFTHGWDLAKATGQPTDLDPALAAELLAGAMAALPDSMRGPDGKAAFGPKVDAAESAPPADRLAAFLGRTP